MKKIQRVFFICASLSVFPDHALAEDMWSWVKAENPIKGWEIHQGKADVTIKGEVFEAELYWAENPSDVRITLKGTIRNGTIVAKELIHNSDHTGSTFTGKLESKRWEGFADSVGGETITLSDGWAMIGLSKAIRK